MKTFLLLLAGNCEGIGLGLLLALWAGRSFDWIKADFLVTVLAVIISLNFIALGILVHWLACRPRRSDTAAM